MSAPTDIEFDLLTEIVTRCEDLARGLLSEKLVVADAIDRMRPGGADNPDLDDAAWLAFYTWLQRTHATGARSIDLSSSTADESKRIDAILASALADDPAAVTLADGTTKHVYPKSYHTLRFLDALDAELSALRREWTLALALDVGDDQATAVLAPLMESTTVRLWAWIITHRGPEMPFDEDRPLPSLPKWTKSLAAVDLLALVRAHYAVNGKNLQMIAAAFPPDPSEQKGSRLSLAGFLGSITAENEPGAARRLIRSTSLGQVFATRVTAAASAREAMKAAKADRS